MQQREDGHRRARCRRIGAGVRVPAAREEFAYRAQSGSACPGRGHPCAQAGGAHAKASAARRKRSRPGARIAMPSTAARAGPEAFAWVCRPPGNGHRAVVRGRPGREARFRLVALLFCLGVGLLCFAPAASAVDAPFSGPCPPVPNPNGDHICSTQVPSHDGTSLDVDVTQPAAGTGSSHPLIVLLHGFGNDKHEWESTNDRGDGGDKRNWNSHWFARHGYYVLTYTARGFHTAPPSRRDQPPTRSGTSAGPPEGRIHLKSRETEVKDTQWLAALVAKSFPDVDPSKVAVSGGSYGGGESWTQASQSRWTFPRSHSGDESLPVLDLQVAVPKYPWTDLGYSLAPNGHPAGNRRDNPGRCDVDQSLEDDPCYASSTGDPESDAGTGNPIGVDKLSYTNVFYLYGQGASNGGGFQLQDPCDKPLLPPAPAPAPVDLWYERIVAQGEPYDDAGAEDPVVTQARRGLTECRSSFYQDQGWKEQATDPRRVAVFSIQGWTDDLFPAVESFRQFKYLKKLNSRWPVEVALGDVGHSRAQNRADAWHYLNNQANQWLSSNIQGSTDQTTTVTSQQSTCPNDTDPSNNVTANDELTATTPERLAAGTLTVNYGSPGALPPGGGTGDPDNGGTDPVVGGSVFGQTEPCRESETPQYAGRYTATSAPLRDASTYIGLGHVSLRYSWTGDTSAAINARLWDVEPGGKTLLVTRGTYRLDAPYDAPAGTLRLPLFGNHWRLGKGHRLRLDLTQVDEPTFRRSQAPDAISFTPPRLTLPIRESASRVVPGS